MSNYETEVFRTAIDRLKIKSVDAPEIFSVTRQTFSHWTNGKTKVPPSAFVALLNYENETLKPSGEIASAIKEIAGRINAGEFSALASNYPRQAKRRKRS